MPPQQLRAGLDPLGAFSLQGKNAVVTGAGSGIGKEIVKLFALSGARVVAADINLETAKKTADEADGEVFGQALDVSDQASVKAAFDRSASLLGTIDVLVNCAAYRPKADFLEMPVDEWDKMHAVNARGVFLCMREAIKNMLTRQSGAIVNISSISALRPTIFNNAHYDSSKAGVDALTRATAVEFSGDGIRINSIRPGGTATEGSKAIRDSGVTAKGPITLPGRIPLKRKATPAEIAYCALFLSSPAAGYITGHHLNVDGGFSIS